MKYLRTAGMIILVSFFSLAHATDLRQAPSIAIGQVVDESKLPSPDGKHIFYMRPRESEDGEPSLWIRKATEKQGRKLGTLFRDGQVYWCPNNRCILVLDARSIEDTRLRVYDVVANSQGYVLSLDRAVRRSFTRALPKNNEILFYQLDVPGWIDEHRALLIVQARVMAKQTARPAHVETRGYLINVDTKTVERDMDAHELRLKYGLEPKLL